MTYFMTCIIAVAGTILALAADSDATANPPCCARAVLIAAIAECSSALTKTVSATTLARTVTDKFTTASKVAQC